MTKIVWADDEMDLLKPYIIYLADKGYTVVGVTNGEDAIASVDSEQPDIVFLDENMPGMSGLDALQEIKAKHPQIPVVMITKSEEENIMEEAIGEKIADYLIKPVNPSQILMCLKRHIHQREIVEEHRNKTYREEFSDITYMINSARTIDEWYAIHRTLSRWDIELGEVDGDMRQMLEMQRTEANAAFCKWVKAGYADWFRKPESRPTLSIDVFKRAVFPHLDAGERTCLLVIDNFRYDQWLTIRPLISELFTVEDETLYTSILPTATQYARNAIFSGLMPEQIRANYPDLWVDEDEEDSHNPNEEALVRTHLDRYRRKESMAYFKINESEFCEKITPQIKGRNAELLVIVLNFIDMLSHSRTDSKMMRELMADEAAYRSLTLSWFRHSPTYAMLAEVARLGYKLVLTTDHGTTRVQNPVLILADKETNTNLRYKVGKNLNTKSRDVMIIDRPKECGLPCPNISSSYMICTGADFFGYPNNYNAYAQLYRNTFQHGGVSMDEMLIPLITLSPK